MIAGRSIGPAPMSAPSAPSPRLPGLLYLFALWVLTNMVVQQPTTPEVPHAR